MRFVSAYVGAVLVTYLIGAVIGTQFVLHSVVEMGLEVGVDQRIDTSLIDLQGLASSYLPLIAVAMLIGLPIAGWFSKKSPESRVALYMAAGFVAIVAVHLIMKAVLGLTGYAPARTLVGLFSQGVAGAVGGLMFARLSARG